MSRYTLIFVALAACRCDPATDGPAVTDEDPWTQTDPRPGDSPTEPSDLGVDIVSATVGCFGIAPKTDIGALVQVNSRDIPTKVRFSTIETGELSPPRERIADHVELPYDSTSMSVHDFKDFNRTTISCTKGAAAPSISWPPMGITYIFRSYDADGLTDCVVAGDNPTLFLDRLETWGVILENPIPRIAEVAGCRTAPAGSSDIAP